MRRFIHQSRIIREACFESGMSQGDIHYLIFGNRKQAQVVSNWTRGMQGVPAKHIAKVCTVLQIARTDLIEAKLRDEREYLDKISCM